jgi:hypothetical protein
MKTRIPTSTRGARTKLRPGLSSIPSVRAQTLDVFTKAEGVYIVPGSTAVYEVAVYGCHAWCQCQAAKCGARCAHSIAALSHHEKVLKMKPEATTHEGGDFTPQQPVKLERGLYGAMFRGYSEPKQFLKYQSTETEEKIPLRFLVTHAANESKIPRFSSASAFPTTKWFYDAGSRKMSKYFEFHSAILAGKYPSVDAIFALTQEERPDLDDLIGWPVALMIELAAKPDKNGIYHNNISAILAPSHGTKKAIAAIYKTAETAYDEKGLRYLSSPKAEYDDIAPSASPGNGHVAASTDEVEDEETVPF